MAFHGSRGSSQGGNRGVGGGSRGRGSGSRGSSSRGRGRGGFRGGRGKPVFDSSRVAQQKETGGDKQSEEEDAREEEEEEELSSESSSDDEEEVLRPVRSYAALMRSLAAENVAAKAKRRKLDHVSETTVVKDDEKNGQNELDIAEDADRVDEPEEGPETATDGFLEGNEAEETEDVSDPFESHFANPNNNVLARRLKSVQLNQWSTQRLLLPKVGRALINIPQDGDTCKKTPSSIAGPGELKLKQKLADVAKKLRPSFDDLEIAIAQLIFNYQDVLYCQRSPANSENLRRLTCLHAVNHVFKTRDRVIKNNSRLAREENNDELELRDQGFTRPKVLMILPTRESCVRMVNMITSLYEPDQQENRKRFDDSYVQKDDVFSDDKTEDFRELFGGNDDDMFRLGLKFTRKTIKYFSQFYNSDIIFTSPLGMRMALGGTEDKKGDSDFLSSIEMVIVDQADALLMQNWEHMEYIFEHLNLQPKEAHGCDFSRVRSWYLDNNAKYFRQTIALSAFNSSELNTLFYTQSQNWAGKVKITVPYPGSIQDLGIKVKQTFSRLESPSSIEDSDTRFTYFTTTIIPALTRRAKDSAGTVIVVPSYADFTRVRNYFANSPATSSLSFGIISEFTPVPDVARARSHFYSGRHSILIYTERAHHFKRYKLRGVRKVIFYGLPENPTFYKEMVGGYLRRSLQEGKLEPGEGSVRAIFSKWDQLKLERIVGTERVRKMIKEKGDTFDFV